jgi:hypothetical protein
LYLAEAPLTFYYPLYWVADHLSLYRFVTPIENRTAEEVGNNLLRIVSSAIVPQMLQSDNGSEVSNYHMPYIMYIFYIYLNI